MMASTLLVPLAFLGGNRLDRSEFALPAFLITAYVCVVVAVTSTFVRYRREQRTSLPSWRRIPYVIALGLLLALCLSPLVTWPLALSSKYTGGEYHAHANRPDFVFLGLFGANAAALMLIWFGRGWSRLGLAVVSCWILFLWAFPLGVGV